MAKNFIFTSESVSEGHPDKMADQISDAILDAYKRKIRKPELPRNACKNGDGGCGWRNFIIGVNRDRKHMSEVVCDIGYDDLKKALMAIHAL